MPTSTPSHVRAKNLIKFVVFNYMANSAQFIPVVHPSVRIKASFFLFIFSLSSDDEQMQECDCRVLQKKSYMEQQVVSSAKAETHGPEVGSLRKKQEEIHFWRL